MCNCVLYKCAFLFLVKVVYVKIEYCVSFAVGVFAAIKKVTNVETGELEE